MILLTIKQCGQNITSFYGEEKAASHMTLEEAIIYTNSQFLVIAIQDGTADSSDVRCILTHRIQENTRRWISGHKGIANDKEVDVT